jgi:hypothetical protein
LPLIPLILSPYGEGITVMLLWKGRANKEANTRAYLSLGPRFTMDFSPADSLRSSEINWKYRKLGTRIATFLFANPGNGI